MSGLTRRELMRLGLTGAAAAGTVGAGLWLLGRAPRHPQGGLYHLRDHRVPRPAGSVELAVARGPDPAANVRKALEALGGMGAFVKRGERVVVKPNVGWNRTPEQAANTHPEVVAEVVRLVAAAGAARVWVADVPVNDAERCFTRSGIREAAARAGATVLLPAATTFRSVAVEGARLRAVEVLDPFVQADRIINVPIVKHHGLSRATLAMKNWYGVLGGQRVLLHQDIHQAIVDLAGLVKPTLTIMDATRVLVANGPSGGSLGDVKRLDTVAAGVDEVALDAFGASLLGLAPADVGFIGLAERAGLGRADWKSLKLVEVAG